MAVTLRFAVPADASALLEIYGPYVTDTSVTFEYHVPTEEEFARRIRSISAGFPYLVCERDGFILGYAYAHPPWERAAYQWNAELTVYLRQNCRGGGLGTALYTALLELLRAQGIRTALGCVTHPNPASEHLHKKLGFQVCARFHRSGWKLGRWYDVQWFEKSLCGETAAPQPPRSIHAVPPETVARILTACTAGLC